MTGRRVWFQEAPACYTYSVLDVRSGSMAARRIGKNASASPGLDSQARMPIYPSRSANCLLVGTSQVEIIITAGRQGAQT